MKTKYLKFERNFRNVQIQQLNYKKQKKTGNLNTCTCRTQMGTCNFFINLIFKYNKIFVI